jgi:hypothetical protein
MRFEERELLPYITPVSPAELQEGSAYFSVNFVLDDMTIPFLETLVFIGRNLHDDDLGLLYFQDVRSYREGLRYNRDESEAEDGRAEFLAQPEDQVHHICEYERALEELMVCSLRRRKLDQMVTMHFEERQLNHEPDPVSATELENGSAYFALSYVDNDRLTPVMDTRVFIGTNLEPGDDGKFYFEDPDSYYTEGIRYNRVHEDDSATFYVQSESELNHVFEFEQALDELMRCSIRRRNAGTL